MKVTTKFYKTTDKARNAGFEANVTVCIEDTICIRCAIRRKKDGGLFLAFPSQKIGNEYQDQAYSLKRDFSDYVVGEYQKWAATQQPQQYAPQPQPQQYAQQPQPQQYAQQPQPQQYAQQPPMQPTLNDVMTAETIPYQS